MFSFKFSGFTIADIELVDTNPGSILERTQFVLMQNTYSFALHLSRARQLKDSAVIKIVVPRNCWISQRI